MDLGDEAFFFVFAFKICLLHRSVTSFHRGAHPPKENPGSAPETGVWEDNLKSNLVLSESKQATCG